MNNSIDSSTVKCAETTAKTAADGGDANTGTGDTAAATTRKTTLRAASTTVQAKPHDNNSLGCGTTAATSSMRAVAADVASTNSIQQHAKITPTTAAATTAAAAGGTSSSFANKITTLATAHQQQIAGAAATTSLGIKLPASNKKIATIATTLQHSTAPHMTPLPPINLSINTTTGGSFGVTVDPHISVENLKKIISKKLKVAKDRICLLHRERELQDGTLKDNNLMDGSKIILTPNVETGLLAQRPENTVMQALESLNDSQVNDFLSGKTPLNLSMRLGDHMMLIQLQLSTVNPANAANASASSATSTASNCNGSSSSSRARCSTQRSNGSSSSSSSRAGVAAPTGAHHSHHHHHHHHLHSSVASALGSNGVPTSATSASGATIRKLDIDSGGGGASACKQRATLSNITRLSATPSTSNTNIIKSSDLGSFLSKQDYESLHNLVKSIAMAQPTARLTAASSVAASAVNSSNSNSSKTGGACPQQMHTLRAKASQQLTATLPTSTTTAATGATFHTATEAALLEQSPIKSLSNLVSSPIKTAIKNIPITNGSNSSSLSVSTTLAANTPTIPKAAPSAPVVCPQDPISAKLTSCLCTRLGASSSTTAGALQKTCIESTCLARQDRVEHATARSVNGMMTSTPNSVSITRATIAPAAVTQALLHKTANNPIMRTKHRHHHHHHHHHHHYHHNNNGLLSNNGGDNLNASVTASPVARPKLPVVSRSISNTTTATAATAATINTSNDSGITTDYSAASTSQSNSSSITAGAASATSLPASKNTNVSVTASPAVATSSPTVAEASNDSGIAVSDTRTLAEASRNLTQTLRKLSKEVFTNKIDLSGGDEAPRKSGSGAVIESMKNHGKGIYSGTFSGTLNPALQDRYGRPKRDISTVIHILNDLLSATPQYSRGARISFEAPSTSAAAAAHDASASASSRNKQNSKHFQQHAHANANPHHHHACVKCIKVPPAAGTSATAATHNHTMCAYGECNGHYASKAATKSNYICCQELGSLTTCGANASQLSAASALDAANSRHVCSCRYRTNEAGEREREHICQKCLVEMDNQKTKSKLDQLRLVMQQRKQKREARKQKGTPYSTRVVGTAAAVNMGNGNEVPLTAAVAATTSAAAAAVADANKATNNTATPSTTTPLSASPKSKGTLTSAPPNEVSPNHIVEEVDTAA